MDISDLDDNLRETCRIFTVSSGRHEFCRNVVNTSRYTAWSFIFLFLYDQFSKLANLFFLIVGLMEQIPGVSPVGRYITLVPLTFILSVSAIKEIIEDIKRRNSDKKMNALKCECFNKFWQRCSWSDLSVGDIVRVASGQTFPADLILVSTSEPTQSCYIQTASLDGETNYKIKQCREEMKDFYNEDDWINKHVVVKCEKPNNHLYKFSGSIKINDDPPFPIDNDQIVLRGSQLKNTHWVIGIVTYTGHETKIMLNSSSSVIKRSTIDHATNWLVLTLMAVLLLLTIGCACVYDVYLHFIVPKHWYFNMSKNIGVTFHLSCITFFILYHNIIPISLMVTLEVVKMIQSYVISHDPLMYSKSSKTGVIVKTSSIIEELGQVNYIFTDKTGTLTCNEMLLRELSIGLHSYKLNHDTMSQFDLSCALDRIDEEFFRLFVINLLLCNTIVAEYDYNSNDVAYQSSSPDETAIITALAESDYKFIERLPSGINISLRGVVEFWKILNVIDFTSARKRMSVIASSPDGRIYLFCKGADNVVMERLADNNSINQDIKDTTLNNLESFARNGLRTLCIAYKYITNDEYNIIHDKFQHALAQINDRDKYIELLANEIEQNMILLGVTGIEDKLQSHVCETINTLRSANIKIWMLTGDKLETAMNVAYSCNLLNMNSDVRILNCSNIENCLSSLKSIINEKNIKTTIPGKVRTNPPSKINLSLVVTGQDLTFALDPECIEYFLDLAIYCESVVCCRVSPLQKKNVLLMVKERVADTTTLAIGDGANDCSMIRASNVGVGIVGKEGMQAANTADFAIGEFYHLTRLLFVHGAACYRRICNCIYFCFYKNILFNLMPFFFDFYNMFSGQVIFSKVHMALFNVFYTSLPPLCFGLLDQTCSFEAHYNVPYLYQSIRKSSPFGIKRFLYWTLNGVLHSFLIFFLCYATCYKGVVNYDGTPMSIALFGNIVLTHTLIVITLKAALELRFWFWMTHLGIFGGFISFIIFFTIFCRKLPTAIWFEPDFLDSDILMYESGVFWFSLGIPLVVMLPDFLFHCIRNTWFTPSYLVITELERSKAINWTEPENIKSVQTELDKSSELKNRRTRKYFGFAFSKTEITTQKNQIPRYTSLMSYGRLD